MNKQHGKRSFSLGLALALTLSLLAGCGGGGGGTQAPASSGVPTSDAQPIGVSEYTGQDIYQINGGKDVSIRFSMPGGTALVSWWLYEEAVEAFQKDYPNVKVTVDGSGDTTQWRQNAAVEFAGSDAPNLSWCVPSYANSFIGDGLIIDWRDVYSQERYAYFTEFLPEYVRENVADAEGRLPFLPHEGQIGSVYYNKTLFAEHGWQVPETFDELLALCDEINAAGIAPFATGGADFRYAWLNTQLMVNVCGVEKTKALATSAFDQWGSAEYGFPTAMEKLQQLIDHKFFYQGINGLSTAVDEPRLLIEGKTAMAYEGIWRIAAYITNSDKEWVEENLGAFPFPAITDCPDGDPDAVIGGTPAGYLIITDQTDAQKEACLELCKYLTSQKYMSQLIENGYSIPAGDVKYDESKVPAVTNECYQRYLAAKTTIGPMDGLTSKPEIDATLKKEIYPMVIDGKMTVDEAVARMDELGKASMD